jgi:uncharacterized membrane protein (UPF0127 family)
MFGEGGHQGRKEVVIDTVLVGQCPGRAGIFTRRATIPFMNHSVVLAALLALCALPAVAQEPQTGLPRVKLSAGMHQIDAQLAQTTEQRMVGLMFRKEMPQHEGMLFVFEQPSQQCFWMKNTLLPLSAAFLDDQGTVVNIEEMKPQTLDSHCSTKPVRYVLEMNQGWFARKGIKPGARLNGQVFQKR